MDMDMVLWMNMVNWMVTVADRADLHTQLFFVCRLKLGVPGSKLLQLVGRSHSGVQSKTTAGVQGS